MIIDERMSAFIDSLDSGNPAWLNEIEKYALDTQVPIIRRSMQSLLKFLLTYTKPKSILEVGTAIGFSALLMSEYAPGAPFFLPNGMILRNELERFWYDEHTKENYEFIKTPIMMSKELWEVSGHWFNYKENMYTSLVDEREFAIKPMNCPGSLLVY